jgi:uncharacterized RmlC-like cupin family protein
MTSPEITPLNYTYKKPETDVWVLNTKHIPINKTMIKDQQIVHLGPGSVGGNHKHPRTEWFIALGDLVLVWLDENGSKQEVHMNPNEEIRLIKVPPFLPHAVVNRSVDQAGILFEMADDISNNVEKIQIV